MSILLTAGGVAQLLTVLVIFVAVLGVTAWVTAWMANYQKQQNSNGNIEVLETVRIANNKYLQLVRVGESYIAIAVCKDTVTMLCQVPAGQVTLRQDGQGNVSFRELFEKSMKKRSKMNSKIDSSDRRETEDGDE